MYYALPIVCTYTRCQLNKEMQNSEDPAANQTIADLQNKKVFDIGPGPDNKAWKTGSSLLHMNEMLVP